jgi:hypothetical protein
VTAYQFRFFKDGELVYEARHDHRDDFDALDDAEAALSGELEVEIRKGRRFVASVRKSHGAVQVPGAGNRGRQ